MSGFFRSKPNKGQKASGEGADSGDEDPYATLPEKVRIGNMDFRIGVTSIGDAMVEGEFGHMNVFGQEICVTEGQTPQALANTLMHEIIHAIHWVYGCFDDSDSEERFTNQTTNGLMAFFQDNPQTMAWILKQNGKAGVF